MHVYRVYDAESLITRLSPVSGEPEHQFDVANDMIEGHGYRWCTSFKPVTAWDRAVFVFACLLTEYSTVWFVEDDVMFPQLDVFSHLNNKYRLHGDLLCSPRFDNPDWPVWERLCEVPAPGLKFMCMMCACRLSRAALSAVAQYVTRTNTLYFHEALILNLCLSCGLEVNEIDELRTIIYRPMYNKFEIDCMSYNLYHPLKRLYLCSTAWEAAQAKP